MTSTSVYRSPANPRIDEFLARHQPETPCVVIDLQEVVKNYRVLARAVPPGQIYYAVKANPAPELLAQLVREGSSFDTASRGEIELVLAAGADGSRISFGNTIKKERDIAFAYQKGVQLYAFDSQAELEKIARAAPGSKVFCRLLMEGEGAIWPLSRKFGCSPDMAEDLLLGAKGLGLVPYGLSFHVGSQQIDLSQWDKAIAVSAKSMKSLLERGVELKLLNMGGGFPAHYQENVSPIEDYGVQIVKALHTHFGNNQPEIIIEPGRGLVGDSGVLQTEVVLISKKGDGDERTWVYLDIGKFGGLAETMGEAIQYELTTPYEAEPSMAVILAGPTCDSADVLYESYTYQLPAALKIGDKIQIKATGAYTTTYSSVGFNGFPPLKTYCI
ncbi:MAG: type III PLP-dependent enzyme [Alphaproteobacteria bacterium]|nr:type III PLP-dependent enzyme [Alphaproteobacteria bacterium]